MVIPVPACNSSIDVFVVATTGVCPATSIVLKMFCEEPLSLLVTVMEPLVVMGPPDTAIPVPAVRFTEVTVPTNWSLDAMVNEGYVPVIDTFAPAVSTTVWSGDAFVMVSVSVVAFVVTEMPVPAATVNVSLLVSATISL